MSALSAVSLFVRSQATKLKNIAWHLVLIDVVIVSVLVMIFVFHRSPSSTTSSATQPVLPPAPAFDVPATKSGKPPQFVVLSFDGSKSIEMWQATRAFAQEMKAAGKPLHFTYFISGVYFLTPDTANLYAPPGLPAGDSAIGFSDTKDDIVTRVQQINAAIAEGHEIGSHVNGHFDGTFWTYDQWKSEMSQFHDLVFKWRDNNGFDPQQVKTTLNLQSSDIQSFRAPLLGKNDFMYQALHDLGYKYDSSSLAATPGAWPTKDATGMWLMPMSAIPLSGTRMSIISMDYNFFVTQSRGRELARRGSPLWQRYYQQMYTSYMNHFQSNYHGTRAPVVIGHHFSTWNDGVYWQVMQDFARNVCGQPEVYCVSFKELGQYLDKHPHP